LGISNSFADCANSCWITNPLHWLVAFYAFLVLALLVVVVLLVLHLRANSANPVAREYSEPFSAASRLFIGYGVVFVLIWALPIAHRLVELFTQREYLGLAVAHYLSSPLQGFANTVVYLVVHRVCGTIEPLPPAP